ncbi:hypothetical protein [Deinococcus roseus]|uniref:Uncharacterized protein n=1 Tax=Deinococcus roseus TaxID=392414 RepID=A0ABQ2D396_9DEIO|nr:hypothetical protein [Deinococcus roseus]GGJ39592.1 hypothetical protein GCM10008938_27100 [Deinococcus roseus]
MVHFLNIPFQALSSQHARKNMVVLFCIFWMGFSQAVALDLYSLFELKGKVAKVSISYQQDLASVLEASYREITFNAAGSSATDVFQQPIGFDLQVSIYTWNPQNRTLHLEVTEEQEPFEVRDSVFDGKGCEIQTRIQQAADPRRHTEIRQCDASGRVLKGKIYLEGTPGFKTLTYQHLAGGLVLKTESPSEHPGWKDYQVKNPQGLVLEEGAFYKNEKNPAYRYSYTFDAKGNWIEKRAYGWQETTQKWSSRPYQITFREIAYL